MHEIYDIHGNANITSIAIFNSPKLLNNIEIKKILITTKSSTILTYNNLDMELCLWQNLFFIFYFIVFAIKYFLEYFN